MAAPRPAIRLEVRVELKPGVLDPEAEAVRRALGQLGITAVEGVTTARIFTLEFREADPERARTLAQEAVDRLLANPVIHQVTIHPAA